MSDAKQCDNCQELYVRSSEANDPHQVTVKQRGDWEHPAIGARISLYNEREHDLIDDCRKCTILAVRKFMAKFGIKERKGESFECYIREGKRKTIYFENSSAVSGEDNAKAQDENRDFFARFNGRRVRITVEVL